MCDCAPPAPAVPMMKGFDEDSVASLSTTLDETQDSYLAETSLPNSAHPFPGGYVLAASYWPKVRAPLSSSLNRSARR